MDVFTLPIAGRVSGVIEKFSLPEN